MSLRTQWQTPRKGGHFVTLEEGKGDLEDYGVDLLQTVFLTERL